MFEEFAILEAIQHDLTERYGRIRFEKNEKGKASVDVFFSKKLPGFSFFKHAFSLLIEDAKLKVNPGNLLRAHIGQAIIYELADPLSIDKLIELLEECQKNWSVTK